MKHIEKIVVIVYILCMVSLMILYGWSVKTFQRIEEDKEARKVKPEYIKIVYIEDTVIEKDPPDIIEETEDEIIEEVEDEICIINAILTSELGRVQGPQEEETYYNLPMDKVVENMMNNGYAEIDYPYYVREDGVKMLGDFVIVATNLDKYPKGTIVQTSLGQGIVCDKHEVEDDSIDIAVEW